MTQGRGVALTSVIVLVALSVSFAAWSVSTSPSNSRRSTVAESSTTETRFPMQPLPRPGGSINDVVLGSIGVGVVDFGASEALTREALTDNLGPPTAEPLSGCVGAWTQIEWNDLIVEFLNGSFVGYRYLLGGYDSNVSPDSTPVPMLLTATSITLGSTLGQLRATYPGLTQTGSFTWTSPEGVHFVVYSNSYPSPPSSLIAEIKIGTCGDW